MFTRLTTFAALSLAAIGISIALVVRQALQLETTDMGEVGLFAALTLLDIVLVLLAAANLRWAQLVYGALFGLGLKARIDGLLALPADDPLFAAAIVLGFAMHLVAIVILIVEVRAQRTAAKLA
jgi:hypothetical protein